MRAEDVSTQQKAHQGRQGAPLLERGGEPSSAFGAGDATAGLVFGRDQ